MRFVTTGTAVLIATALALSQPSHAAHGAGAPLCDPEPTVASWVASAELIVIARASGNTTHVPARGALITRFAVQHALKGRSAVAAELTVDDCDHARCAAARFRRGDLVLLLLWRSTNGHYWLRGHSCRNGFDRSLVAYDPTDPIVQQIVAATGRPAASIPLELQVREGDLVFQKSRSPQSEAVALATRSSYTHMGVVVMADNRPTVLEAVHPVKMTRLSDWVARGDRGHVVVKRLADATTALTPAVVRRMHSGRKDLASDAVQRAIRQRFGAGKAGFNPSEPVVSPQSVFDAPGLITVFQN